MDGVCQRRPVAGTGHVLLVKLWLVGHLAGYTGELKATPWPPDPELRTDETAPVTAHKLSV